MTERDVSAARAAGGVHGMSEQLYEDDLGTGSTSPIRTEDAELMEYEDAAVVSEHDEEELDDTTSETQPASTYHPNEVAGAEFLLEAASTLSTMAAVNITLSTAGQGSDEQKMPPPHGTPRVIGRTHVIRKPTPTKPLVIDSVDTLHSDEGEEESETLEEYNEKWPVVLNENCLRTNEKGRHMQSTRQLGRVYVDTCLTQCIAHCPPGVSVTISHLMITLRCTGSYEGRVIMRVWKLSVIGGGNVCCPRATLNMSIGTASGGRV